MIPETSKDSQVYIWYVAADHTRYVAAAHSFKTKNKERETVKRDLHYYYSGISSKRELLLLAFSHSSQFSSSSIFSPFLSRDE